LNLEKYIEMINFRDDEIIHNKETKKFSRKIKKFNNKLITRINNDL